MQLWNKICNFDFFQKIFFSHMKELFDRSPKAESEVSKFNPQFKKNLEGQKMDRKFLNYFFTFWPRYFLIFFNLRILYQKWVF